MINQSKPNAICISAGFGTGNALLSDGSIWCWGIDQFSDAQDVYDFVPLPKQLEGIGPATSITTGNTHNLALLVDGSVWAWGWNPFGQVSLKGAKGPVRVELPPNAPSVTTIAAGDHQNSILTQDGRVWRWGMLHQPENGKPRFVGRPEPVQGIADVLLLAQGSHHSVVVLRDQTIWSWGKNDAGQLGNGTITDFVSPPSEPGKVARLSHVIGVVASEHTLALRDDGTVWAWGYNFDGRIHPDAPPDVVVPMQIYGLPKIKRIALPAGFNIAWDEDDHAWAWGLNNGGQFGDGTTDYHPRPVRTPQFDDAVMVKGWYQTLALKSDGTVWACGPNESGYLGDGTTTPRLTLTKVKL